MPDQHSNFAASSVLAAPSPALSGASLTVQSGDGALFPTPPYDCIVCPAGAPPRASTAEIVRVTGLAGDVFTITRGPQAADPGGINRTIVVGDQFFLALSKRTFTDIETMVVGGALAGSLPNPTLAVPVPVASGTVTAVPDQPIFATGACTVTLPTTPVQGARVQVAAAGGAVTINRGGTDQIFNRGAALTNSLTLMIGTNVDLRYLGTLWYVVAGEPQGVAPWLQLPSTKQLVADFGAATLIKAGTATATWSGSSYTSANANVALPGASGNVFGVAIGDNGPSGYSVYYKLVGTIAGVAVFQGVSTVGNPPAGSATFYYLIWGS